jgi:hypothetical protein
MALSMDKHLLIAVAHVAVIVPFLLFVGFQRAATPDWAYRVLFAVGVLVLVYHGIKSFTRWVSKSPAVWVNLIHALLIAPLLIWIGYHGKQTERPPYEMLLMTGFAALGYHLYSLVVITQTFVKSDET